MSRKLFLYIDILGFKDLVESGFDMTELFEIIDENPVHRDRDFTSIVFSDTMIVYASEEWNSHKNMGVMWLVEFAQYLFYRLISKNINIRAYITEGEFHHYKMKNIEAYYGEALIECYLREKDIKCTGVFIDRKLSSYSDIFKLTKFDENCSFVHVMQHLDMISFKEDYYPISGEELEATGMEWWVAYLLYYIKNLNDVMEQENLPKDISLKYSNTWKMIESKHSGLLKALRKFNFEFSRVIEMDWSEPMARIGTENGAWG